MKNNKQNLRLKDNIMVISSKIFAIIILKTIILISNDKVYRLLYKYYIFCRHIL